MKRNLCALLLLGLLMTAVAGCGPKKEKFSAYSFDYFDTVTAITGYAGSQAEFDRISGEIFGALGDYHRLFTIYTRYEGLSNLCTVNELHGGEHRPVEVDRRIIDLLLYAKEIYQKTDGKTNVAMGSVLSLWHGCREAGREDPASATLPDRKALEEAARHTDIRDLVIDEEACTVFLADPKMTLDVGAVAKGYAVEMVARRLEEQGIEGYVLNVGGNVRTVGTKPNGEAFVAGVEDPEGGEYLVYVPLADRALVTSGSYQRYYVVDGERYHHIIDPATCMPANYYSSVSVLADSSADGDALSTALFCMELAQGQELIRSLDGIEAMWVQADGSIFKSDGFEG